MPRRRRWATRKRAASGLLRHSFDEDGQRRVFPKHLKGLWHNYGMGEKLIPTNAGVRDEFKLGIFPPDHGGNHAPAPAPPPTK
jgi:hypothetical protein